jgi:hypothetical protein
MGSTHNLEEPRLPWGLARCIAFGQIVAWGILYYAFSVVIGPMQAGTGWSKTFVNGGLSLGLLVWGLCALPVGAWIQRKGGREIMTLGSLLGDGALLAMGSLVNPAAYLVCLIILGASMASVSYKLWQPAGAYSSVSSRVEACRTMPEHPPGSPVLGSS